MNIEEIKQFKTIDGSVFNYLDEAKKYNRLLEKCDNIENALISTPEDDVDFVNGIGWIQHPKNTKTDTEQFILLLYNEWFGETAKNISYYVSRMTSDVDIKCLNHLITRWMCMSNDNREYRQSYYAQNPYMAGGGQIN